MQLPSPTEDSTRGDDRLSGKVLFRFWRDLCGVAIGYVRVHAASLRHKPSRCTSSVGAAASMFNIATPDAGWATRPTFHQNAPANPSRTHHVNGLNGVEVGLLSV